MAVTWTATMTIVPPISSSTYKPVNLNCWVRTCEKSKFGKEANSAPPRSLTLAAQAQFHLRNSELHVNLVESAQNVKHENDNALLSKRKITKPPHFGSGFFSIINRVVKSVSILSYIKVRQWDFVLNPFEGRMLQGGLVFRQSFLVRSYDVGADYRATMEALMNYLQETALNHCKSLGLLADGFGCTPEMCKRNLVWVIRKMQIAVDNYPLWNSVIEVDTWTFASGRNGMRREWFIRDPKTGKTMVKAIWNTFLMNKETRRLSNFTEEITRELEVHTFTHNPFVDMDDMKPRRLNAETADYVRTGLAPRWNDLDVNHHVNNVKYINWILEGVPRSIMENCELHSVNLEFRRECRRDSSLQSLSTLVRDGPGHSKASGGIEFDHLLLLENGLEIARARTKWRPRIAEAPGTHFGCREGLLDLNVDIGH